MDATTQVMIATFVRAQHNHLAFVSTPLSGLWLRTDESASLVPAVEGKEGEAAPASSFLKGGGMSPSGPSLPNRSTSSMSGIGPGPERAAHDFMGFDPSTRNHKSEKRDLRGF